MAHVMARIRPLTLTWILAMLLALSLTTGARAGTYVIDNCPAAPAPNGDSGPWTVFGSPQDSKGTCGGGAGDYIGPRGGFMNPATTDGVEVTVPPGSGITIHEAKVWWAVPHQISGADTFALASALTGGNGGGVGEFATPLEHRAFPDDFELASTTTTFILADYCSNDFNGQGCVFGAGANNDLQLFGAQLTLADPRLPGGSVTGGGLAGTGTLSGTQSLGYYAEDADSGVRLVQLLLDGQPVAQNDYIAKCPYTDFAACPVSESDALSWNTASASNGMHEIALRVTNAAGNVLNLDNHTVTIENQPIQTNGSIRGPRLANGESPCTGEQIALTVNGRTSARAVSYGTPVTVKGVLHCGSVPVRNAQVAIATVGAHSAAIDSAVQTAPDGSFSYKVPNGPDRALRFSYTAYSNDPGPSATAVATIRVRPRIALKIAPRQTSNGHTISWTGRVTGGPYPRQGVTLVVEVREGDRWRIFDQAVTNASGRFRYSYRFHATYEPTTYTFRVALPDTGAQGYPYAAGASNTIRVHVSP